MVTWKPFPIVIAAHFTEWLKKLWPGYLTKYYFTIFCPLILDDLLNTILLYFTSLARIFYCGILTTCWNIGRLKDKAGASTILTGRLSSEKHLITPRLCGAKCQFSQETLLQNAVKLLEYRHILTGRLSSEKDLITQRLCGDRVLTSRRCFWSSWRCSRVFLEKWKIVEKVDKSLFCCLDRSSET